MDVLINWLQHHALLLWVLSGCSVVLFLFSLAFIPFFVSRIPADYFVKRGKSNAHAAPTTAASCAIKVGKNLVGVVLVLAGIVMLVIPGQGLLTIVIGLALTDFPGKHRLVTRCVRKRSVFKALNWLRRKTGKPPLQSP